MNKVEEDNYTTRIWYTKYITDPDKYWYISKFFKTKKQQLPIEKQRKIIELKKEYLWEYIPKTILCETHDGEYFIKQQYIRWKTLAEIDISTLSTNTLEKLLDLIKKYIRYHKEQWWEMDTTWYQYYKWNPWNLERRIRNFLKVHKNFLASTNIMISDDWNVYMVDVCESSDSRIFGKIKNIYGKPFIRRTVKQLEKLLQQKIVIEKKNKEIFDVLNNQ